MGRAGIVLLALAVSGVAVACDFGSCNVLADCAPGDLCTIFDCVNNCCEYSPRSCDDGIVCTDDSCNPRTGCVHAPHCPDDGLVCNGSPGCIAIVAFNVTFPFCLPAVPPSCDDENACTLDSCAEPSGCQHVAVDCDDGDACTTDTCDPATGCHHEPVAGCCRSGADCPADACTIRLCTANVCTAGIARSCDDRNPRTDDSCDPTTGCHHVLPGSVTSTTLPTHGGGCASSTDCPAVADPCLVPTCKSGACTTEPATGFDGLACICQRPDPQACAGQRLPRTIGRRRAQACTLIHRAEKNAKKIRRLVGRAEKLLDQAVKALAHAKHASAACTQATGALLADDVGRARTVHDQVR